MQRDRMILKKIYRLMPIIFIVLFLVAQLFQFDKSLLIFGTAAAIMLAHHFARHRMILTPLDISIGCIFLVEFLSYNFSINQVTSLDYLKRVATSVLFYLLIRVYLRRTVQIKIFTLIVSLIIAILLLVSFFTFAYFESLVSYYEFQYISIFKHLHTPAGFIINDWGLALLCFLAITMINAYLFNKSKMISIYSVALFSAIILCTTTTFSRGCYLSVFIFLTLTVKIMADYIKRIPTNKIAICAYIIFTFYLIWNQYEKDIISTIKAIDTVSQNRSIQGRLNIIEVAIRIWRENPIIGIGSGNFSLAANEFLYEDDNYSFTTRVTNSVIQALVEKGIIGISVFFIFARSILYGYFQKKEEKKISTILLGSFVAIFFKEMTFSTFFENSTIQTLVFSMVAMFQNSLLIHQTKTTVNNQAHNKKAYSIAILMAWSVILYTSLINHKDEIYNDKFITEMTNKNYVAAKNNIEQTSLAPPYLINRSIAYFALYKRTMDRTFLELSKNYMLEASEKNPYDFMIIHDLAQILYESGEIEASKQLLIQLAQKFPAQSLYNFSLATLLYDIKEKSIDHHIKSIFINPNLLDSPAIDLIRRNDTAYYLSLISKLREYKSANPKDPISLGIHGKLMLSLGDTITEIGRAHV